MTLLEEISSETFREASIPVLETKRLTLRAPCLEDAKTVALLANDKRIAENTARIPHPYKLSDAESFIGAVNKGEEALFLITARDGVNKGAILGACGFVTQEKPVPELGYWLGVEHWGQGFGTEAARAAIDYYFEEFHAEQLFAGARVTNPASRNILEKCGFQWSGVELHRFESLGCSTPVDKFRLSRGVWSSLKNWGSSVRRER